MPIQFIDNDNKNIILSIFLFLIIVILSLVKFNITLTVLSVLFICVSVRLIQRTFVYALILTISYIAFFMLFWKFTGQDLANLLPWIKGGIELSSGYSAAMSLFPNGSVLFISLGAILIILFAIIFLMVKCRNNPRQIGLLLVLLVLIFFKWKHGFVRSEKNQTLVFLWFYPLAFSLLFVKLLDYKKSNFNKMLLYLYGLGVIICIIAIQLDNNKILLNRITNLPLRTIVSINDFYTILSGNKDLLFDHYALRQQKVGQHLTLTKHIVRDNTVDVMNHFQWIALTNGLNYKPRPVIQGYSTYTPYLASINAAYYAGEMKPEFILLHHDTIDERFPTLDDSKALIQVLNSYIPIAREGIFLIMEKGPYAPVQKFEQVRVQDIHFGEVLNVPFMGQEPLFMSVDMKPTFLGRLIIQLFQQPPLFIRIDTNIAQKFYRFVPGMAKEPILLTPLVDNNDDVLDLIKGSSKQIISKIMFVRPSYLVGQLNDKITVSFFRAPGFLNLVRKSIDRADLK